MIEGMLQQEAGDTIAAIETLRSAIELADLWRIHYALGHAYLEGGFFAEAFDEFRRCLDRQGEATAMFLDDTPTYRYLSDLPYWLARAEEGLGIRADADEHYRSFLARRSTGPLAEDARQRLQ
jgi:tetratricopeptide (TPR) repeat protein